MFKKETIETCKQILTTMNKAAKSTNHEIVLLDKETGTITGFEKLIEMLEQITDRE